MSELIFKRGVQADLPSIENRDMDAFYVVTDAKKMHLGDITWEDTESVKEEIKQIIADNELTVAASLTELKESKLDASAHTKSINTLTETFNGEIEEVQAAIESVSDNVTALTESVNNSIDGVSGAVTSLTEEVIKNETTVAAALTKLNEGKLDISAYTEITDYVSSEELTTILEPYAKKTDMDNVSGQVENLQDQMSAVTEDIEGIQESIETLSGHVLDNELVIAASLTDLEERKLNVDDYQPITDYVNQETFDGLMNDLDGAFGNIDSQFTEVNAELNKKVATTTIKTLSGISLIGEGENISIKTINNESIFGEGNIAIDLSLFQVVAELPVENFDTTKVYVVPSATSGEGNIYSEYVFLNGVWEKVGEYNSTVSLDGYATEAWVNEQGFALSSTVESLQEEVLKNETTVAAALTKLHRDKMDASAFTEAIASYVTSEDLTTTLTDYATVESVNTMASTKLDASAYTEITDYVHVADYEEFSGEVADALNQVNSDLTDIQSNINVVSDLASSAHTEIERITQELIDDELAIAAAVKELHEGKLDISAYTEDMKSYATKEDLESIDLSEYATKEDLESIDLSEYATKEDLESIDLSEYATNASVNEAISAEATARQEAISAITVEIIKDEKTIAAALTKLNNGKLDISAYTASASNFITSDNLTSILGDYATVEDVENLSGHVLDNEVTIAAALTELKNTKLDITSLDAQLSGYVTLEAYNAKVAELTNKITTLETTIQTLTAEVEENETVAAAAISLLDENKVSIDKGADVITIKDTAGVFSAATVEGALKELYDMIQSLHNNA